MSRKTTRIKRPGTLAALAENSHSLEEFGYNLRDWQHEVRDKWRGKKDFFRRISTPPELLRDKFPQGDVADAYLAAYALWLGDRIGVPRVDWARDKARRARSPWFSGFKRASLLRDSPAHFIERDLFTRPDASFLDGKLSPEPDHSSIHLARSVRETANLTQEELAKLLDVGLGTVRNWEQGRTQPKGAAAKLLNLLQKRPELIDELAN